MNPYTSVMIGIPMVLSILASLAKQRYLKWIALVLATVIFWGFINKYVDWAYTHPLNPNDGAPRTVALILGWLIGLVTVVLPTFWVSKKIQWLLNKRKKHTDPADPGIGQSGSKSK